MAFIRASSGILEASAAKKLFQEVHRSCDEVHRGSNTHLLDTHGCSYGSLAHADAHKDDVGQARTHRWQMFACVRERGRRRGSDTLHNSRPVATQKALASFFDIWMDGAD